MSEGEGRSTEGFGIDRDSSVNLIVRTAIENNVDDPQQIAYMLATAQHETRDFAAPEEDYGRSQARKLGYSGGEEFYGRGYVHLTHDYNYEQFDELLGLNGELARNPDKAKDPELAARILVIGMRDGLFTGKRLDRYINDDAQDFYNARRIVNGITKQKWTVKAAEDCESYATEWAKLTPSLVEAAREQIARESYDPLRDIQETTDKIRQGTVTVGIPMTEGLPDYLRLPHARQLDAMSDGTLLQGERDPEIRALQENLNKLGITDGQGRAVAADRIFGRSTREAVENFQLWSGLPANGLADRDTLTAVRNPRITSAPARPGDAADLNNHEENRRYFTPQSPDDLFHPDHGVLEQIRTGIRAIDKENGRSYDDASERISRCLLAACKDNRGMYPDTNGTSLSANALDRVDHVLIGSTGNIFAVEGGLNDPAHRRACVPLEHAARTPIEQSDQKLLAANHAIHQERELARQQELVRGVDDPSHGVPTMARQ